MPWIETDVLDAKPACGEIDFLGATRLSLTASDTRVFPVLRECSAVRQRPDRNGTDGPVSRSFACPRMPADTRSLSAQILASPRNTLRDNHFVLAVVDVS